MKKSASTAPFWTKAKSNVQTAAKLSPSSLMMKMIAAAAIATAKTNKQVKKPVRKILTGFLYNITKYRSDTLKIMR